MPVPPSVSPTDLEEQASQAGTSESTQQTGEVTMGAIRDTVFTVVGSFSMNKETKSYMTQKQQQRDQPSIASVLCIDLITWTWPPYISLCRLDPGGFDKSTVAILLP